MFFSVQQIYPILNQVAKSIKDNKVLQNRFIYTKYVGNKKVFENFLFKCVTRPDLSGVPLSVLHVQTSVEFL